MTSETKRTCDACGVDLTVDLPRLVVAVSVVASDKEAEVQELDFHSYAHLIDWARTQPEPV